LASSPHHTYAQILLSSGLIVSDTVALRRPLWREDGSASLLPNCLNLKANTARLRYKNQALNAVQGNNISTVVCYDNNAILNNTLRAGCRLFNVKPGGTYCNRWT
jgi:hypothetical protein